MLQQATINAHSGLLDPTHPHSFATRLLAWFEQHGRHDLPWQHPRDVYRVWLSEIMLQQTQAKTVIPYFQRFITALPSLSVLAHASPDEVMALWSGLGYYARARNLHETAKRCMTQYDGQLPTTFDELIALPGIGRSTAGAILALALDQRQPILDGNVKRVLTRWAGIEGWPGRAEVERRLWTLAEALLPHDRLADYVQAQMDLGATVCTRNQPACSQCPLQSDCIAHRDQRVAELPTRKPAKLTPRRECVVLIALDRHNRVLLERRDDPGVWQGLWSLPEAPHGHALDQLIAGRFQADSNAEALPRFEHVFSHYRLGITPWLWLGVKEAGAIAENGPVYRWVGPKEWPNIGLPAPIRKLLESLEMK